MANRTKIKTSISADFRQGNFYPAFINLFSLPHHEVANILSKKSWLEEKAITQYFWESFCIECPERVFSGETSKTVLNWYLKDPASTFHPLNELLVNNYPDNFIESIKRNRSFLDEVFLEQISDYEWSEKHSIDIKAFAKLRKDHVIKQKAIQKHWDDIKQLDLPEILSCIIHWIDVKFYADCSETNREKLRQVFNYALSFVLTKKKMKVIPTEKEFSTTFLEIIRSNKTKQVDPFLNNILDWLNFETTELSSYCFDDNFIAESTTHGVTFKFKSEEDYESWKRDGERYYVNASRYFAKALQIYNYEDEEGLLNIPPGKSEQDKETNHKLYVQNWKSQLFLQDLHVRNLLSKEGAIHVSKALGALNSYSTNRRVRYVEPMEAAMKSGQTWYNSFLSTIKSFEINEAPNLPLPFMFISRDDLTNIYKYSIPGLTEDDVHHLIEHFSFEMNDKWEFDPFNISLSILETPFVIFGNFVFASTSFFAVNDWFYSIAQRILNLYNKRDNATERNETATEMEIALGQKFEDKGWNVKIISAAETNAINGDIDIFVDDSITQLLIQLKRTRLKLDLASNYIDSMETDLKAAGQLNEAVISIRNGAISSVKIMPNHKKWIVTTSFEGTLKQIDGCTKVNYFDLLWALNQGKFTSLDELREFIKTDVPFKER